jgi:hypothetical protein
MPAIGFIRGLKAIGGQRGAALVIVLSLLVIMSLLGTFALNSTHTELNVAGNYRAGQQALYAAERAIEYAMASEDIYSTIGEGSIDLNETHAVVIAADTANSGLKTGEVCRISYLNSGLLPPGAGSDPTRFQARYYTITVTTEGPAGATARVEAQVARVVPR